MVGSGTFLKKIVKFWDKLFCCFGEKNVKITETFVIPAGGKNNMKMVVLMENTCQDETLFAEHGLSVYIETKKHKLLADTGASAAFMDNARRLGVDLQMVDTVILSHGHYDHAGGITEFCRGNKAAQIYMQNTAGADYYHDERYIGIDKEILKLPQVRLLEGDYRIDEELDLFTHITGRRFYPQSNLELSRRVEGKNEQDPFDHEQCLVVHDETGSILISGCAHNGILNVLDRYREIYGDDPDLVISGFHMMKKTEYTREEIQTICQTARELKKLKTTFYTGHCTGQAAIRLMQPILGEQLISLYTGMTLSLGE